MGGAGSSHAEIWVFTRPWPYPEIQVGSRPCAPFYVRGFPLALPPGQVRVAGLLALGTRVDPDTECLSVFGARCPECGSCVSALCVCPCTQVGGLEDEGFLDEGFRSVVNNVQFIEVPVREGVWAGLGVSSPVPYTQSSASNGVCASVFGVNRV